MSHKESKTPSDKPTLDIAAIREKPAYSVREFCQLYGISRQSLANYERDGIGPAISRIGGRVLISRAAAETWLHTPRPKRGRPRGHKIQPTSTGMGA